ncbi:hypothetical protein [Candidatus Nitrosotenuis sp. DW1]|uniref:hypothetical protein n=1 Tax=Candidatus Nitrosotenuis sp. DW1 TaxID=2259672 RepID=UPI0015CE7138|nr:hypothetical protein [Candidatus Nitrosotenuis sp. DW1]QLH08891.1 hypothetical protein DSQ19_04790 [Candidatus Nitrosotenuis sp. DW1]
MRRFIIRKEDAESSIQSKEWDPMSFTERTVFFKKDPNAKNQSTIDDLDKEDFKQSDSAEPKLTTSTLELRTKYDNEDKDTDKTDKPNNTTGQSQEIKKLFDQSLGVSKSSKKTK